MSSAERREFQRLRLQPAVAGTFAGAPVSILEIGVLGARIGHDGELGREVDELRFADGIALRCEVVRSEDGESGLRFLAAIDDSGDRLRALLGDLVTRELASRPTVHQQEAPQIDGDKTVRGIQAGYVAYRLERNGWTRRAVFLPEQPPAGFTVARGADPAEMQRLCRVYEVSDEEGRRLIRMFAELSVSEAMEIPPKA